MKSLFILLTVLSSLFVKSASANDETISLPILQSFQNSFTAAKEVRWVTARDFIRADFEFNGQYLTAFYSLEGKLVGVTKNISSTQLPVVLQTTLKKEYSHYWISDLFELSNDNGVSYYVTLENADGKVILQSGVSGWHHYQKKAKF